MAVLSANDWRSRIGLHLERLNPFAKERTERMAARMEHPVNDFLFEYYSFRPSELLRWSPGADVMLEGATPSDIAWKEFIAHDRGLILPADSFPKHRLKFADWATRYLKGIAERAPSFYCFGLHEWAMVYRTPDIRHSKTPLRVKSEQIADLVESEGLRCTHFDAFRFFTPAAAPRNRYELTRINTDQHDQKGCLHVNMDLYKYAYKLAPWCAAEVIADAFLLAWEIRQLDMRASPYDLHDYGLEPIKIETRAGREEYSDAQRELSLRAEPIRERLLEEYRKIYQASATSNR